MKKLGAPPTHTVLGEAPEGEGEGQRPRRLPRDTRHIRQDQASNLLNAWAFSEESGSWLNLHVVIHWERLDLVAERSVLERQGRFLDRLGKWLRRRKKRLAYVWTMEFSPHKGTHTHLLLSARWHPRVLGALLRRMPEFLVGRDAGAKLHRSVIVVERNHLPLPNNPKKFGRVARTPNQRRGLIAYLLKGAEPGAALAAGINAEDQGAVKVRRCGVSRSLDWAARRRGGWREHALAGFDFSDLGERRRRSLETAPGSPSGRLRAA